MGSIFMASDMSVAIKATNIYKKFPKNYASTRKRLWRNLWEALRGELDANWHLRSGEFWALKDISFTLPKGHALGLIGLNGSGKSTLLKLINGTYLPDHGSIEVTGRIGALIELSAGLQMNMSGRENIFIKGALLGFSRQQIVERYDTIVEFAELGDFIDAPVRTYSSGMKLRLGFSIAVHMDPEILLIDEILSVGDFRFRQKCLDKINQMRETMSVIFVSHNMSHVLLFCDEVIVLNKGIAEFQGDPAEAIKFYTAEIEEQGKKQAKKTPEVVKPFHGELFHNEEKVSEIEHYWADAQLNPVSEASTGGELNLVIKFRLHTTPRNLVIGVPIWDRMGNFITSVSSDLQQVNFSGDDQNRFSIVLNFPELILNPNDNYVSVVAIVDGPEYYYRGLNDGLRVEDFRRTMGYVTAPHRWILEDNQIPSPQVENFELYTSGKS